MLGKKEKKRLLLKGKKRNRMLIKCSVCGIEKSLENFSKDKSRRFGVRSVCKKCISISSKEYLIKNPNKIKIARRLHRINNKAKLKIIHRNYYLKNKEKRDIYRRNYERLKYKKNSQFRLNNNISGGIRLSLKNGKDGKHWEDLVGYTLNKLKKHLQKLFQPSMTWDNYGKSGWVIDHKIPKTAFNFTSFEHQDFKRCWALKNLQPMWALENIIKSDKLKKPFQPSLMI